MTIIIDRIITKAGVSWDPLLKAMCDSNSIPYMTYAEVKETEGMDSAITDDQRKNHLDILVEYHRSYESCDADTQLIPKQIYASVSHHYIGIEVKHLDLHQSMMGHGKAGILAWELQRYYLPLRASGFLEEVWVMVTNTNDLPFFKRRNMILKYIDNLTKPKAKKVKSKEEIDANIDSFEDENMALMKFIHDESGEFRDDESLYKLCFMHRIPVLIAESQEKICEDILENVGLLDHGYNLSKPLYSNHSDEINIFETMLRSFPDFTQRRMDELKTLLQKHLADEFEDWYSFNGMTLLMERVAWSFLQKDAFWIKFWEMWMTGKNPLPIKEREKPKETK